MTEQLYYHFSTGQHAYDRAGEALTVGTLPTIDDPVLCWRGWHGSKRALDALEVALERFTKPNHVAIYEPSKLRYRCALCGEIWFNADDERHADDCPVAHARRVLGGGA